MADVQVAVCKVKGTSDDGWKVKRIHLSDTDECPLGYKLASTFGGETKRATGDLNQGAADMSAYKPKEIYLCLELRCRDVPPEDDDGKPTPGTLGFQLYDTDTATTDPKDTIGFLEVKDAYLGEYASCGGSVSPNTEAEAKKRCAACADCSGVTLQPDGTYTLREQSSLKQQPEGSRGKASWLKQGKCIDPPSNTECKKKTASGTPWARDCAWYESFGARIVDENTMGLLKPPCLGESADEHWHPNTQAVPKKRARKPTGRRLTEKNVDEVDSE